MTVHIIVMILKVFRPMRCAQRFPATGHEELRFSFVLIMKYIRLGKDARDWLNMHF
jgi:hypothetical protein